MIPDAKKKMSGCGYTKPFFFCRNFFSLPQEIFPYCKIKILKPFFWQGNKNVL